MEKSAKGADLAGMWGFPITPSQVGICLIVSFLPMVLAALADYQGWLVISAHRLQTSMTAVGIFFAIATYAALTRKTWGVWPLMAAGVLGLNFLNADIRLTRELAQGELLLLNACASAASSEDLRVRCAETRIRPDRLMCDFGKPPDECLRDMYRDAGWSQPTESTRASEAQEIAP